VLLASISNAEDASLTVSASELGFEEILFVKRKPYSSDHYYTDINNGTSADRFVPENGIYVLNIRTKKERPVVTGAQLPGGKGFVGRISLSFDARRIIFDARTSPEDGFRIWEVLVDGSGLRQVSFPPTDEAQKSMRWNGHWHTDDIHPAYLPDGSIVFSSTRCEHTVLCGGSAALVVPVLHRMNSDGTGVEQLSNSPVSEFCPTVRDDGRILYHRWEYIDKGARVGKTIWTMNPDGSASRELYGGADDTTTVYMYPQSIPNHEHLLVCVGTCHYPQGGCVGSIMTIDLKRGQRTRGPDPDEADFRSPDDRFAIANITPHVFVERRTEPGWHFRQEDGDYVHDRSGQSGHLYTHPFPLSDTEFLVSYKAKPSDHYKNVADAYSLWLIDTSGGHLRVHADAKLSCWHPTPLVPRRAPAVVRSHRDEEQATKNEALCIVSNVYEGMNGVERGEIKWLRINEAVPRYWDTGRRWSSSLSSSGWKAALWPRVQWGVVPVEEDGSAHFVVPANRDIFFQALDKSFREVQRERTYVNYRPGEIRSCGGCHGRAKRNTSRAGGRSPLALSRSPSRPEPQPCDLVENGGDGRAEQVIHYPTDIQPIFDAHCVSCHVGAEPAGDLNLTNEVTRYYSRSYEELARKKLSGPVISEFMSIDDGDRGNYNGAELPPRSLGSRRSTLIDVLTDPTHPTNVGTNHSGLLSASQLMVLSRWVDSNYQFYGTYYRRHQSRWRRADPTNTEYDPRDFRRRPTFEEAIGKIAPKWHR